jgi:acetyl-CoA carboxylase carboxyl transferase subunit alpha
MESYYDFERPISELEKKILDLQEMSRDGGMNLATEVESLQRKLKELIQEIYANLSPWQRVQLSRHPSRPYARDYIGFMIEDFIELHGDRKFSDDAAIIGGFGKLDGTPVLVIGQEKGRGTKEKIRRNFGMAKPEGYRKAIRLMEMASRFDVPILT